MSDLFQGVLPPVTTPFGEDGELLYDSLTRNFETYLEKPVSGFLLLGSNGEAAHLGEAERLGIIRLADQLPPHDRRVIVGVNDPGLHSALRFVDSIAEFRIDALLVSVPAYYKNRMTQGALIDFFVSVAERSPFPVLLYNVPQFSGLKIPPSVVEAVSAHPDIVGMKDSSGDLIYLQEVLRASRGQRFQVILGSAQILAAGLSLGVEAAILAVGCALPELPDRLMSEQRRGQDIARLQSDLFEIAVALTARYGVPGVKHAMDRTGFHGGACRRPLLPLSDRDRAEINAILEQCDIAREVMQANTERRVRVGE